MEERFRSTIAAGAKVLDDCPGDLSYWYLHISKGAWPFSAADQGWPISNCTPEGLKAICITCGPVLPRVKGWSSDTLDLHSNNQPEREVLQEKVACEISSADELILTKLIFSGVFKDVKVELGSVTSNSILNFIVHQLIR
ncbi:hypothetical protein V2J09_018505 [Rumex salicifolius]